jgi:hypothetical protein
MNGDDVTPAQFAVDSEVEQREITRFAFDLQLRSYRPDVAWL